MVARRSWGAMPRRRVPGPARSGSEARSWGLGGTAASPWGDLLRGVSRGPAGGRPLDEAGAAGIVDSHRYRLCEAASADPIPRLIRRRHLNHQLLVVRADGGRDILGVLA